MYTHTYTHTLSLSLTHTHTHKDLLIRWLCLENIKPVNQALVKASVILNATVTCNFRSIKVAETSWKRNWESTKRKRIQWCSVSDPDPNPADPLHLAGSGSTSIPAPDPDPDPLRFLSSDPDPLKKALIWIRVAPITERWIQGSGSTFPKCVSQDPDPDPRQNEMDPKRC